MSSHVILDNVTHKELKVNTQYKKGHGFDLSLSRVFPVEFSRLQAEYPIFFTKNQKNGAGAFEAVALFGFNDNENLYLSDRGWTANYIPLGIQRQPFLIGFEEIFEQGVPTQRPRVHIDADHPSVSSSEGQPVFLPQGGESPFLGHINSVLKTIHDGHSDSADFFQALEELELIEPLTMKIDITETSTHNLTGLYTINEEKLPQLNAAALESLHSKGYLQHIYMILASMPNITSLINRKRHAL